MVHGGESSELALPPVLYFIVAWHGACAGYVMASCRRPDPGQLLAEWSPWRADRALHEDQPGNARLVAICSPEMRVNSTGISSLHKTMQR